MLVRNVNHCQYVIDLLIVPTSKRKKLHEYKMAYKKKLEFKLNHTQISPWYNRLKLMS